MAAPLIGIDLPARVAPGYDPVAAAVEAERLGYDLVSTSDHPAGTVPTNETWTLLTWVAARTSRIRVATRVLGVPYRPPAMVAKMAETLDRLSGGRLVLGLGGGYSDDEFRAFGLPVPTPREKVDGLGEAIEIARGLWSRPKFGYAGRRYRTEAADLEPKPARPVPVWVGTYGDRALAVTGRLADGWIPSLGFAPPERIPAMRDRIRAAADRAGRPPVTMVYNLGIDVGGPSTVDGVVGGSPDEVVDRLAGFLALGFAGFNVQPAGRDRDEQVHRVAEQVIPALAQVATLRG